MVEGDRPSQAKENLVKNVLAPLFVSTALLAFPALAQASHDHTAHLAPAAAADGTATLTSGEVRRIDKDAKKLTIRHGAIQNLEMPPMTMVFQVTDPAMLDAVKVGDKVQFAADQIAGALTVTRIEAVK